MQTVDVLSHFVHATLINFSACAKILAPNDPRSTKTISHQFVRLKHSWSMEPCTIATGVII